MVHVLYLGPVRGIFHPVHVAISPRLQIIFWGKKDTSYAPKTRNFSEKELCTSLVARVPRATAKTGLKSSILA